MSSVYGAQNHASLPRLGATLCMAILVLVSSCSVAVGAQIRSSSETGRMIGRVAMSQKCHFET